MSFHSIHISGTFTLSEDEAGGEKSNFGKETVSSINGIGSVQLNETTVKGHVHVGGNINATDANVGGSTACGSITVTSTECRGDISAVGSITSTYTKAKTLSAGAMITANSCSQLGSVNARGFVNLNECPSVLTVSANNILLRKTTVQKDAFSSGDATVIDSKVGGTLSCASNHLFIEGSEIDTIDIRCSLGGNDISLRLIDMHMNSIFGPSVASQPMQATSTEKNETGIRQVLELHNCIVKNVIFEGKNGEVVLSADSSLTGKITGGKLRS